MTMRLLSSFNTFAVFVTIAVLGVGVWLGIDSGCWAAMPMFVVLGGCVLLELG